MPARCASCGSAAHLSSPERRTPVLTAGDAPRTPYYRCFTAIYCPAPQKSGEASMGRVSSAPECEKSLAGRRAVYLGARAAGDKDRAGGQRRLSGADIARGAVIRSVIRDRRRPRRSRMTRLAPRLSPSPVRRPLHTPSSPTVQISQINHVRVN